MDRHRLPGEAGGGADRVLIGLALLFAYLFLVALYESWTIPIPVLLSVAVGGSAPSPRCSSPGCR
jgi:multidrug efflux pump subunit AcrB